MADLLESGRIADIVIAVMVLEAAALFALARLLRHGLGPVDLAAMLLPGFFLVLALRGSLTDASLPAIAGFLLMALICHLFDLRRRWRG